MYYMKQALLVLNLIFINAHATNLLRSHMDIYQKKKKSMDRSSRINELMFNIAKQEPLQKHTSKALNLAHKRNKFVSDNDSKNIDDSLLARFQNAFTQSTHLSQRISDTVDEEIKCPNDCSNNGACEEGFCLCFNGYDGEDCSKKKNSDHHFNENCEIMSGPLEKACITATAKHGLCSGYSLIWRKICYQTCQTLQGHSCSASAQADFCFNHPSCPSLCMGMMEVGCNID